MTSSVVEGLATSIGEELTEAAGFLSTRLTQPFLAESVVQNGYNSATGTAGEAETAVAVDCTWNGTTTVLCTDTTGVVAGKWLRLDSDGQVFEISLVVANTSFTLLNPAGLTIPTGTGPSSWLVPTIVTHTTATFLAAVTGGMLFQVSSGALSGDKALVNSRDSTTQITLRVALRIPVTAFTTQSWVIVSPAETSAVVENTLDWPSSGTLYLDGIHYRFTGKTPTTLTGLAWLDGEYFVSGAKQDHAVMDVVADWSRNYSALDTYRRSYLVEFATGVDLDIVGLNVGLLRPVGMSDATYREVIKASAYTPRGTVYAAELALEAMLGETLIQSGDRFVSSASGKIVTLAAGTFLATVEEGMRFRIKTEGSLYNETVLIDARLSATTLRLKSDRLGDFSRQEWEITQKNWVLFEDLTVGSLNHAARVYMTSTSDLTETSAGKTYLECTEKKPADSTTVVTLDSPTIRTVSVRWAPEGGPYLIAEGTTNASTDTNGLIVTGTGIFPAAGTIHPGDIFSMTHPVLTSNLGRVSVSNPDTSTLNLGVVAGVPTVNAYSDGHIAQSVTGASWKVWRDKTNCRYYKPSEETVIAYEGDAGTALWAEVGGGNEATNVTVATVANRGQVLRLVDGGAGLELVYQHVLRIEPESEATFEILLDHDNTLAGPGAEGLQICFGFSDGERTCVVGIVDDGTGSQDIGFVDEAGNLIGSGVWFSGADTVTNTPGFSTIRIVKDGRNNVKWYHQWSDGSDQGPYYLAEELAYGSFPATAADWIATLNPGVYPAVAKEVFWGILKAGTGHEMYVKHVDFKVTPHKEHWNTTFTTGSLLASTLTKTGTPNFSAADVGKNVRITEFSALNADFGNSLGEWEIASFIDVDNVTLQGPTRENGTFTSANKSRFIVRDTQEAFVWPDHRGHSVEILTGPHAGGVYPISEILDPVSFANVEDAIPATAAHSVDDDIPNHPGGPTWWDSSSEILYKVYSNAVLLDTTGGVPTLPSGFTVDQAEVQWRLVPTFPTDPNIEFDLIDSGSQATINQPTLRSATMAASDLMEVVRSRVLTGQIHDRSNVNTTTPAPYSSYPFYLNDSFGGSRTVMDNLLAAAIIPKFDEFFVDESGPHILE